MFNVYSLRLLYIQKGILSKKYSLGIFFALLAYNYILEGSRMAKRKKIVKDYVNDLEPGKLANLPITAIRIRESLNRKGMTAAELAAKIGKAPSLIQKYIEKDIDIGMKALSVVADALDVTTDYLIGRTDVVSKNIPAQEICNKTGLSEQSLSMLLTLQSRRRNRSEYWSDKMDKAESEKAIKTINYLLESALECDDMYDDDSLLLFIGTFIFFDSEEIESVLRHGNNAELFRAMQTIRDVCPRSTVHSFEELLEAAHLQSIDSKLRKLRNKHKEERRADQHGEHPKTDN